MATRSSSARRARSFRSRIRIRWTARLQICKERQRRRRADQAGEWRVLMLRCAMRAAAIGNLGCSTQVAPAVPIASVSGEPGLVTVWQDVPANKVIDTMRGLMIAFGANEASYTAVTGGSAASFTYNVGQFPAWSTSTLRAAALGRSKRNFIRRMLNTRRKVSEVRSRSPVTCWLWARRKIIVWARMPERRTSSNAAAPIGGKRRNLKPMTARRMIDSDRRWR